MTKQPSHESTLCELHRSLDERWRPEDVAPKVFAGLGVCLACISIAGFTPYPSALSAQPVGESAGDQAVGGENQSQPWTRAELLKLFQGTGVRPASGAFLIPPGNFPILRWEQPLLLRELYGDVRPNVRWFDSHGNEVTEAVEPGRYGAYIEVQLPEGPPIRRALTFFCFDPAAVVAAAGGAAGELPLVLPDEPPFGLSAEAWNAHRHLFEDFARQAILRALLEKEQAAILAAGLAEWDPQRPDDQLNTPAARHQQYHLDLKRRLLAVEQTYPAFDRPRLLETPVPILVDGSPVEAGLKDDLPDRLHEFCQRWLVDGGEPFTIVVARRGVVVFHRAYGERQGEPVTKDTVYPLMSLTKTVTGMMLAQFLDQGLLELDRPLGEVLPDLPTEGHNVITLRQCMMHVTGLAGQSEFGGLDNPWLDNVVAHGLEAIEPAYSYSGVAYDLAGMAMQLGSGKSIPRLFQEHLFSPLEFEGAKINGLGIGGQLRAIDLARLGQLLLNGGSYGDCEFFGRDGFRQLMPQAYDEHYPDLATGQADYGLGIRWAGERHPRAGEGELPDDATIMSGRTLGHGAFSGTVFRVDLENEIVVAVGRFSLGERHGDYVKQLLTIVMDARR